MRMTRYVIAFGLLVQGVSLTCPIDIEKEASGDCIYQTQVSIDSITLDSCETFDAWIGRLADIFGGKDTKEKPYKFGTIIGPIEASDIRLSKRIVRIKGANVKEKTKLRFEEASQAEDFVNCLTSKLDFLPLQSEGCCEF